MQSFCRVFCCVCGLALSAAAEDAVSFYSPEEALSARFGAAVASVPDVDGDGGEDIAIGEKFAKEDLMGLAQSVGTVWLHSGVDGSLIRKVPTPNPQALAEFGAAVAGVADVNGDDIGDVIVGAPKEERSGMPSAEGQVYVMSGADGAVLHTLSSENPTFLGFFGTSVAALPDVSGDGVPEILIGAPGEDPADMGGDIGRAYVFNGATGARIRTLISPNEQEEGLFGQSVAAIEDINSDGVADIVVGAPDEDELMFASRENGYVYVFSGADGTVLREFESVSTSDTGRFGYAVAGLPDLNDDDTPDILVGAPDISRETFDDAGGAWVVSGLTGNIIHALEPDRYQEDGEFGIVVRDAPDINNDGVADVLVGMDAKPVGSPDDGGRVFLFSGATGATLAVLRPLEGTLNAGTWGTTVAALADRDGAGHPGVVVGSPESQGPNTGSLAGQVTLFRDFDAPEVVVVSPQSPATNEFSLGFTISFSEVVGSLLDTELLITNAAGMELQGGSESDVFLLGINPAAEGPVTVQVPAGVVTDASGLANTASNVAEVVYDITPPDVSIGPPSVNATTTGPVTWNVSLPEAGEIQLKKADVLLQTVGTAFADVEVGGTGATRTVTLSNITGAGSIAFRIAGGAARDLAGNESPESALGTGVVVLNPIDGEGEGEGEPPLLELCTFGLGGDQVVPPNGSGKIGTGVLSFRPQASGSDLVFEVTHDVATPTAIGLYRGESGKDGILSTDLGDPKSPTYGLIAANANGTRIFFDDLQKGRIYVAVDDASGQIIRGQLTCASTPSEGEGEAAAEGEGAAEGGSEGETILLCEDNLLQDPGFEGGTPSAVWDEQSILGNVSICDAVSCSDGGAPRSGDHWLRFATDPDDEEDAAVLQTVTLAAETATLSFYLWISSDGDNTFDALRVEVDNNPVRVIGADDTEFASGYALVQVDLSEYADGIAREISLGATLRGQFLENLSVFNVDDICLTVEGDVTQGPGCQGDYHAADTNGDNSLDLSELLRVIQFYNADGYGCQPITEDGYAVDDPDRACCRHNSDYLAPTWEMTLTEVLRAIQLFNVGSVVRCVDAVEGEGEGEGSVTESEDGYCFDE